jgi:RND family efflux transporter MFP subunit
MLNRGSHVCRQPGVLAFASGAVLAALAGCNKANQYVAPPPPQVSVAQPVQHEIVQQLEFTGTTQAVEAVDVRARVMGYLKSIEFKDGDYVEAGKLLFVIEQAPFQAALDAAKAQLQRAEASLGLAKADLARTEPLAARGALTAQELDVRRANVATADADVAAAKAAVKQAELDLAYTEIKAPISGRTSRHLVDIGNLVQPGTTMLTRLESYDPIYVYFAVSEADVMEFLRVNQATVIEEIRKNPPKIYMGLSNEQGFPHEGKLDFAEIGVDPQTGTQMRRGEFPNSDRKLLPGLFARVRLPIGDPHPGLMVPDRAIATDQRGEYVLAVNEKNVVEHKPVKLGMRIGRMRVVVEGVNSGDWLIVNGLQRGRPGAEVKPEKIAQLEEVNDLQAANDPALGPIAPTENQIETANAARSDAAGAGGR